MGIGDKLSEHVKLFQEVCRELSQQWHNRTSRKFKSQCHSVFCVCHAANMMLKTKVCIQGKKLFYHFVSSIVKDMSDQAAHRVVIGLKEHCGADLLRITTLDDHLTGKKSKVLKVTSYVSMFLEGPKVRKVTSFVSMLKPVKKRKF